MASLPSAQSYHSSPTNQPTNQPQSLLSQLFLFSACLQTGGQGRAGERAADIVTYIHRNGATLRREREKKRGAGVGVLWCVWVVRVDDGWLVVTELTVSESESKSGQWGGWEGGWLGWLAACCTSVPRMALTLQTSHALTCTHSLE